MINKHIISIFIFLTIFSFRLKAEENSTTSERKRAWHLSLGYGVAVKNNIRKDNQYTGTSSNIIFSHIPLVQMGWGPVQMGAQGLSINLLGNREIAFYLNINRAGDRYYTTGMENRKDSWFFGPGLKFHNFNFLLAKDINGRSKGIKASAHYIALYPLTKKIFTRSSIGIECYNQAFSEYYFGVRANEVSSSRPEYHAHNYCIPSASFFPGYKYSDDISFLVGTSFKILPKAIILSPTTKGGWLETAIILGASWKL